ncbi:MAG: hypothetical protein RSA29_04500 [Clostridium sp.]|uniref:hypothetical protein n=1 Tax=Clostridium sp. TaxID=1506 RepID=UPI0030642639
MRNKNIKIYKNDEYALGKECFDCKTKDSVFYNKRFDIFTCSICLRKLEEEFENRR